MPEVRLEVYAETHGAPQALKQTEDALAGVERQGGATIGPLKNLWVQFALGDMASRALSKGLSLAKEQVVDSIKAAMESEKANKSLDAALEITGRAAADLGGHFKSYADELMQSTVYDDEAIKGAQALLVQLTNLDKDGIDKATRGAIGLASVFSGSGMSLESAANLVAKAMTGSVGALSRYGIKVAENLSPQEKQAALLAQLEKLYGRATAETDTFSGRLSQLKNRWGEVQEAAGGFITRQKGVIDILDKASQAVLDYLTMDQMLEEATRSQEEQENRRTEWLGKAAAAAGWQYQQMAKLIEAYGGVTPALLAAINAEKYGIEIKQEYRRVIQEERAAWIGLEAARKAAEKGTNAETTATIKLIDTAIIPGLPHLAAWRAGWGQLTPILIEADLPIPKMTAHYKLLAAEMDRIAKKNPLEETMRAIQKYEATGGAALASLDAVVQQGTTNRMIALDNEYQHRLAVINKTIKDEDKRQQAIAALDDEFAKKRRAASVALAISSKAMAISSAIISTHEAAAKAMAQGGFILGIPWSAIIEALGWVQVGLIAAQPIPLAKGGYFDQPTIIPGRDGRDYEIGHGPEIASPVPVMRQVVREELRALVPAMAGGSFTVYIQGPVFSVQSLSRENIHRSAEEFWVEMEHQAHRRGFEFKGR